MVKAVIIFLAGMALVGMISNAVAPGRFWQALRGIFGLGAPRVGVRRCKRCGRPLIGSADCDCGKKA